MSSNISLIDQANNFNIKLSWFQEALIEDLKVHINEFKKIISSSSILFINDAIDKIKIEYTRLIEKEPDVKEFILEHLENPISILIIELSKIKSNITELNNGTKTFDEFIQNSSVVDDTFDLNNVYLIYIVSSIRYLLKEWIFTNKLGILLMEQLHDLGCGMLVRETFLSIQWDWNTLTKIHLAMFVGTIDHYLPILINYVGEDYMTPLMRAIHMNAEINIGLLILRLGADVFIQNSMGLNAIDLAVLLLNFKYLKSIITHLKNINQYSKINIVKILATTRSVCKFKLNETQKRDIIKCLI